MRLIQDRAGENWHSDDPAGLYIDRTGHLAEPPQKLRCFVLHDSLNKGDVLEIEIARLEFMAAAMFGEARGNPKWTGDAYRHAIYRYTPEFSAYPTIVVVETHGGGTQGYYIRTLTAVETWSHLASTLPSELLWNVCRDLCDMYHNARYVEQHRIHCQFVEGRLKKRRRRNRVYVEVLPERADLCQVSQLAMSP